MCELCRKASRVKTVVNEERLWVWVVRNALCQQAAYRSFSTLCCLGRRRPSSAL